MKTEESDIQKACLDALLASGKVAFAHVTTNGKVRLAKGGWLNLGFKGQLDIAGMLKDGRHFEIEIKRPGFQPSEDQENHMLLIRKHGGVAGWATNVDEALEVIG